MTAVVGILNKSAAAIAADSAVTVSGPRGAKIFNSANKIFRISKTAPVGIMIYNQGEFMGTPWDTILKLYRQFLGVDCFDKVADYKKNFIQYLRSKNFFCDKVQQKMTLHIFAQQAINSFIDSIVIQEHELINSRQPGIGEKFGKRLSDKIDEYINEPINPDLCCEDFKDFEMKEFDDFGFAGIPTIVQEINARGIIVDTSSFITKVKLFLFKLLKEGKQLNFYSGLVFTGFGHTEIFPSLIVINISLAI